MSHVVSSKSHPWGQRQSRPLCNPAPGGTPSHRSPLFSGTRSLFPTSCESPPPVVTFQLQFESFGISPTPVFEFGVSKSPIPVFEFGVSLFQEQFQRSDHWQVCAASTTAERLGGTTIQMFYANPTTAPNPATY